MRIHPLQIVCALGLLRVLGAAETIPAGTWVQVPTQGVPAQAVGYDRLVYAPAPVSKAILLGNYHEMGSEPDTALVEYDVATDRWDVMNVGGLFHDECMPEAGHSVGLFDYDPDLRQILYYGSSSGSNQPETPYHLWWLDPLAQSGRDEHTAPKPGFVNVGYSTYDPVAKRWVFFAGGGGVWSYDATANAFAPATTTGTPPETMYFSAVAFDPDDHCSYVFAGQGTTFRNDVYTFSLATGAWTKRATPGPRPAPRYMTSLAYDSLHHVFLVFGGADDSHVYTDTWAYDPVADAWTELHPAQTPSPVYSGLFEKLAYDAEDNLFILANVGPGGFADGNSYAYGISTWFFRYAGDGPAVGRATATPASPPPGALNRDAGAWAKDPVIASAGGRLCAAWVECGAEWDSQTSAWFHVRVDERVGDGWSALGADFTALNSEFSGGTESHGPSLALIGGTPWVAWYDANNSGSDNAHVRAKRWDGSAWVGGPIGLVDSAPDRAPFCFQGRSSLADVGGVPHIAFLEVDKNYYPEQVFAYVKAWDGTAWTLKGGALNRDGGGTTTPLSIAESIAIAADGATPYVAWTEGAGDAVWQDDTPPRVHVSRWDGAAWAQLGDALNLADGDWATDATIAVLGGEPYVAWTERTRAGAARLAVARWHDGAWSAIADRIGHDAGGWVYRPSLAVDAASGALYVGWAEQAALSARPQAYVARWQGGAWTTLGGSLNADAVGGSVERVNLAVYGGAPVALWSEVGFGAMRQVYAARWDGSAWQRLAGDAGAGGTGGTTTGGTTTGSATTGTTTGGTTTGGTTTSGTSTADTTTSGGTSAGTTTGGTASAGTSTAGGPGSASSGHRGCGHGAAFGLVAGALALAACRFPRRRASSAQP